MRWRTPRDRQHEEQPVRREPVSVGSLLVAVTLKPASELPDGAHLEGVLEELGEMICELTDDWYERRGSCFLVCAPDVA